MPKLINNVILNKIIAALFFFILLIISFGQIGRIGFGSYPAYMYLYEIILVVFIVLLLPMVFNKNLIKTNRSILVFMTWLILSLLVSMFWYWTFANIIAILYALRLEAYFLYFILLKDYLQKNSDVKPIFQKGIYYFLALTIVYSFIQYFFYPNIGNIAYLGWDPHLYRMVGVFFEPQIAVGMYGLIFLYFFARDQNMLESELASRLNVGTAHLFAHPRNARAHSSFTRSNIHFLRNFNHSLVHRLFLLVVITIMIVLTISRGGIIAFVITLLFIFRKKLKLILFGILIILLVFITVPKPQSEGLNLLRTSSIQTRIIDYQKAIKIWLKSPVVGIGYNHIRFEKDLLEENLLVEKYNPSHASSSFHSSFLIILVTLGVIGLGLYLWVLWDLGKPGGFAFYSTLFLSLISIFDNVLLHPFILFVYFSMIAISQTTRPSHGSR